MRISDWSSDVCSSDLAERAKVYRRLNSIPGDWGTAVNVQAMVFGNMGDTSATGVAFTRDPATGENCYYGEFLINAQGEDVVAGTRNTKLITKKAWERARAKIHSIAYAKHTTIGITDQVSSIIK